MRLSAAVVIRVSCAHRDQVLVQGDGLVQPLPGLVQRVDAVSNTYTIATAVNGHSFQLARRRDEMVATQRVGSKRWVFSTHFPSFHFLLRRGVCFVVLFLSTPRTVKR